LLQLLTLASNFQTTNEYEYPASHCSFVFGLLLWRRDTSTGVGLHNRNNSTTAIVVNFNNDNSANTSTASTTNTPTLRSAFDGSVSKGSDMLETCFSAEGGLQTTGE
jgi:hypothetical protein